MLKFPLFSLKIHSIALLLTSFLIKIGKITLFFISPHSRAKVSEKNVISTLFRMAYE